MIERVTVRVRDCACPGLPHPGGDEVYMRAKPSVPLGLAVEAAIIQAAGSAEILKRSWMIEYIRHGVVDWNFLDEKGDPRPFDAQELIDDFTMGMAVAEKGDELYSGATVDPLVGRLSVLLRRGRTGNSSSRRGASTRSRSGRSSQPATEDSTPSTEWNGTSTPPPDRSSRKNGSGRPSGRSKTKRTAKRR